LVPIEPRDRDSGGDARVGLAGHLCCPSIETAFKSHS
jgi:hypothetical protein